MVIKPEEYSKQVTNDMFIAHSLGVTQTTQNMEFKLSPWDQDELIKYRKINLPMQIEITEGITLVENDPQVISRDEILPPDSLHDLAFQVRVGPNISTDNVTKIKNDLETPGLGWSYAAPLPVLEKLKKPIPKPNGGYWLYRVVEGRHRWQSTMEYKDFPCYIEKGHEADIKTLGQALNNPDTVTNKRDNDEASVQTTVQEQFDYYEESNGKKGVEPEVGAIVEYIRKNFNHISSNDRKRFAEKCLAAEGILKDLDEYNYTTANALIKKYMPEKTIGGEKDENDKVGFLLRYGRDNDEQNAFMQMGKSIIACAKEGKPIPEHYFMGSMILRGDKPIGIKKGHNPTSENLEQLRIDAVGCFEKYIREFVVPLGKLYEEDKCPIPKTYWLAQNNTKGETKDKTY